MKRIALFLMALLLVVSISGIASAGCPDCCRTCIVGKAKVCTFVVPGVTVKAKGPIKHAAGGCFDEWTANSMGKYKKCCKHQVGTFLGNYLKATYSDGLLDYEGKSKKFNVVCLHAGLKQKIRVNVKLFIVI